MKNCLKNINQNDDGFLFLRQTFPIIREAKITEEILVCPQIGYFMIDSTVDGNLSEMKGAIWRALKQ
jgi:hypothetical protein